MTKAGKMIGDMPVAEVRRLAKLCGIDHFKVSLSDQKKGWPAWEVKAVLRSGVTVVEMNVDVCQAVADVLRAAAELQGVL